MSIWEHRQHQLARKAFVFKLPTLLIHRQLANRASTQNIYRRLMDLVSPRLSVEARLSTLRRIPSVEAYRMLGLSWTLPPLATDVYQVQES